MSMRSVGRALSALAMVALLVLGVATLPRGGATGGTGGQMPVSDTRTQPPASPPPWFAAVVCEEGTEGVCEVSVPVPDLNGSETFDVATREGVARENVDYVGVKRVGMTLTPGAAAAQVLVPLIDDDLCEVDEDFAVVVTLADRATIEYHAIIRDRGC
jgi:hypothetical protein